MRIIKEPVPGILVVDQELVALRLDSTDPVRLVYLSYALVTRGPEHQILPSVLLDDWGMEIGRLDLYRWIEENGQMFPRAEVFGTDPFGVKTQYFLRDLELSAKYPLYAFAERNAASASAARVNAILIPDDLTDEPQRITRPSDIKPPLRKADVEWWRVGLRQDTLDFLRSSS